MAAIILGSGIQGDAFADVAIGADGEPRRTAAILGGLRRGAERREWIDHRARADGGVAGQMDVGDEPAAVTDHDMRPDHAVGSDRHVLPDHRAGGEASGWVDCGHWRPSHDHGADFGLGDDLTGNPGLAAEPHIFFLTFLVMWNSIVSPGTTGLRNLALSMVRKYTFFGASLPSCDKT
jgi:hypothetical protein